MPTRSQYTFPLLALAIVALATPTEAAESFRLDAVNRTVLVSDFGTAGGDMLLQAGVPTTFMWQDGNITSSDSVPMGSVIVLYEDARTGVPTPLVLRKNQALTVTPGARYCNLFVLDWDETFGNDGFASIRITNTQGYDDSFSVDPWMDGISVDDLGMPLTLPVQQRVTIGIDESDAALDRFGTRANFAVVVARTAQGVSAFPVPVGGEIALTPIAPTAYAILLDHDDGTQNSGGMRLRVGAGGTGVGGVLLPTNPTTPTSAVIHADAVSGATVVQLDPLMKTGSSGLRMPFHVRGVREGTALELRANIPRQTKPIIGLCVRVLSVNGADLEALGWWVIMETPHQTLSGTDRIDWLRDPSWPADDAPWHGGAVTLRLDAAPPTNVRGPGLRTGQWGQTPASWGSDGGLDLVVAITVLTTWDGYPVAVEKTLAEALAQPALVLAQGRTNRRNN